MRTRQKSELTKSGPFLEKVMMVTVYEMFFSVDLLAHHIMTIIHNLHCFHR